MRCSRGAPFGEEIAASAVAANATQNLRIAVLPRVGSKLFPRRSSNRSDVSQPHPWSPAEEPASSAGRGACARAAPGLERKDHLVLSLSHAPAWLRFARELCGLLMDETAGSPIDNASRESLVAVDVRYPSRASRVWR